MTVQHFRDLETTRRYATLLAVLLEAKATPIDQALDLHDRMIGALFNRAKRRHAEEFQQSARPFTRRCGSIGVLVKLCVAAVCRRGMSGNDRHRARSQASLIRALNA
jgi:hypothetical protein